MLGELDTAEIKKLLERNSLCHIGCTDGTNVYIVPISYQYQDDFIMCYSLEGLKIEMMRKNPSVCIQVDEIKNINEWKSVVVNGTYEEITDENELRDLRPHYTEYMLRKRVSLTALPEDAGPEIPTTTHEKSAQVFYRIRFKNISGRYQSGFISAKELKFDVTSIL
ncbi:MAG TPA: pyridoxamine 5'-phosphate oxidase family protein [Sphingobacteriaceae bacterium]